MANYIPKDDRREEITQNETETDPEKLQPGDIVSASRFASKISNFWYHNKWVVIITSLFVIMIVVCLFQMFKKTDEDMIVVYAGTFYMTAEQKSEIESALENILPRDFDGNGEKTVLLNKFEVYSEEEMKKINGTVNPEGETYQINSKYNADQFTNFTTYIATGEATVCLVSRYLYDILRDGDRLCKVSDICGTDAISGLIDDGYGILIFDTQLHTDVPALHRLPDDTVLCMVKQHVWGSASKDKVFKDSCEMFDSMAKFTVLN